MADVKRLDKEMADFKNNKDAKLNEMKVSRHSGPPLTVVGGYRKAEKGFKCQNCANQDSSERGPDGRNRAS